MRQQIASRIKTPRTLKMRKAKKIQGKAVFTSAFLFRFRDVVKKKNTSKECVTDPTAPLWCHSIAKIVTADWMILPMMITPAWYSSRHIVRTFIICLTDE